MNNCTLANNSSGKSGGGIYGFIDSVVTVNNSTFTNNTASSSGGGIYSDNSSIITVNNSTFANNTTSGGGRGGALYNDLYGTCIVNNSTVANNTASGGGGIYNSEFSTLNLTNSIVASNNGGNVNGLITSGSSNLVDTTNINLAPLGYYGGPTMTMPPLPGSPAIDAGTDSITNFFATDQRGFPRKVGAHVDIGAVESGTAIPGYNYTVVTTTNDFLSEFTNNGVSLRSAVAYAANNSTITFASNLSGQTILLTNGQIALSNNVTIDGSALAGLVQLNGNGSNRIFYVNAGVTATFNSLIITNGREIANYGGSIQNRGSLTVNNCRLANNSASNGGGIMNYAKLTLNNCTLADNNSSSDGGGIYNNAGTLTLSNCTLANNNTSGDGGGIANFAMLTLNNCTCFSNRANATLSRGGAVYSQDILVVNNCTLVNNSALDNGNLGGGIFNNSSTLNLTNSIVSLNTGGDIYGSYSGISNLVTVANINLAPLGNYGGPTMTMPPLPGSPAIDAGTDSITNSFATDQRGLPRKVGAHVDIGAVESGTAIPGYNYAVVTATNDFLSELTNNGVSLRSAVAFVTNNASITFAPSLSGQTILLTNGQITLSTNVTIDGSTLPNGVTVSGNNASRLFSVAATATAAFNSLTLKNGYDASGAGGGGIYVSGKLTLTNCVVANNTTTYGGGGVCNRGTLTVNNSTVAGNNAPSAFGGGIYNSSGANLAVNNSTLAKNTAANSFGGGIFTQGSASVNSSTLANNSASSALGGGIYFLAGTLNLTNCIIASNAGGDVAGAGTISSFVNSLTNRPDINLASLGNYGGPTPTMPPLPGSPAIDAGNDAAAGSLTTDQRGYPRVSGAHMDIGAVEAQYASAGNSPLLQNTAWSAANGGTLQFTFTNTANTDFTALTATNVALPLINWTVLGKVSQISAGQYQFAATNTAAVPQQFYRVVSP